MRPEKMNRNGTPDRTVSPVVTEKSQTDYAAPTIAETDSQADSNPKAADTNTLLAENHIVITRTLFNEFFRIAPNPVGCIIFLAAALTGNILAICADKSPLRESLPAFLSTLGLELFILFWISMVVPRLRRRRRYKTLKKKFGQTPEMTVRFYPENLTIISCNGDTSSTPYKDISSWKETNHLWILIRQNTAGILLEKDGFRAGDFETILSCIKAAH